MDVVVSGRVPDGDGFSSVVVEVEGDHIRRIESGDGGTDRIVPGLVDVHCHGGGGHSFDDGVDSARAAAGYHLRCGVTSIVASLVSASHPSLLRQVGVLSGLVREGVLAGIHLEGPYLSERRRGAHDVAHLRDPSLTELAELLAAGAGAIRVVTLAPERPGALAAVEFLVARGVTVAVGHTDATTEQTRAALTCGATLATHLFNAMPGLHHREGGPVLAVAENPAIRAELIADGHHVAGDVLRAAMGLLGRRTILVSDAMAAAGAADGRFRLGSLEVHLADGQVRTADGHLAGSAITLLDAVRYVINLGVAPAEAFRAATSTPAAVVGLQDRGTLREGDRADLLLLRPDLQVERVMRGGRWVPLSP